MVQMSFTTSQTGGTVKENFVSVIYDRMCREHAQNDRIYNKMLYTTICYNTTYKILHCTKMLLKYYNLQQYTTIQFNKQLYTATAK